MLYLSASGQEINSAGCDVPFAGCQLTVDNDAFDFYDSRDVRVVVNRIRGELETVTAAALASGGDSEISGI
jgi:hypothetical protein